VKTRIKGPVKDMSRIKGRERARQWGKNRRVGGGDKEEERMIESEGFENLRALKYSVEKVNQRQSDANKGMPARRRYDTIRCERRQHLEEAQD